MKKSIVILLALIISVLSGCCAGGNTASVAGNTPTEAATVKGQPGFDEKEVVKNIKVKAYTYSSYAYKYLVLVFKNNSDFDCKFESEVTFYNSKGKMVDTSTQTVTAFSKGTETVLKYATKEKYKKYDYQLSASDLTYHKAVTRDLKKTVNTTADKAIVSVENTGKKTAEYTKVIALFFKGKKLIYTNLIYIGDSNSQIKPGKTQKGQLPCFEKFDKAKVYLDSYAR